MFYKLLGIAVWRGGKYFLKRRYGAYLPTPVLVGLGLAAAGGVGLAVLAAKRNGSSD
jgi:Kef-type K+ transport system membrane component KefB